jgi:DNA-binding HxlR family transcriptional regulator
MQVTPYAIPDADASGRSGVAYHAPVASPTDPRSAGSSPLAAALDRIGDRWSPQIIQALLDGPRRNADLQEDVAGIAPNILADRLRRLEADGLITTTAYSERPPRFDYRLTVDGRALAGALRLLADWGARHAGGASEGHEFLRHEACGTALDARWYCPTCGEIVGAAPGDQSRRL